MADFLFNHELLRTVDGCDIKSNDTEFICVGKNLVLRPLSLDDYHKGFLQLLAELTDVGNVNEASFVKKFNSMKKCYNSYFIIVVEDTIKKYIIASATLVLEQKFIHSCTSRGRIEDLVVNNDYRGNDLGKMLVSTLIKLAEFLGCYKVTLECKDSLVSFYERLGLHKEINNSNYLQKRF